MAIEPVVGESSLEWAKVDLTQVPNIVAAPRGPRATRSTHGRANT